jgi:tetratricopeptide (TPR) repeat protein
MYTEAEIYYDRAISLAPDIAQNYTYMAKTRIQKTGTTEGARQVLEGALKRIDSDIFVWMLTYFDIYDGRYQSALNRIESIKEEVFKVDDTYAPKDAIRGFIYELMGQNDQALIHYKKARILLEEKVKELPDDPRIHAGLGRILAHLGLKNEAIAEGEKAVNLMPVSQDPMEGPEFLVQLAEIYTIVGDYSAAIDKLEYLLEIPAGTDGGHIGLLKIDPVWNPLRDHPRFKKLLKGGK